MLNHGDVLDIKDFGKCIVTQDAEEKDDGMGRYKEGVKYYFCNLLDTKGNVYRTDIKSSDIKSKTKNMSNWIETLFENMSY